MNFQYSIFKLLRPTEPNSAAGKTIHRTVLFTPSLVMTNFIYKSSQGEICGPLLLFDSYFLIHLCDCRLASPHIHPHNVFHLFNIPALTAY